MVWIRWDGTPYTSDSVGYGHHVFLLGEPPHGFWTSKVRSYTLRYILEELVNVFGNQMSWAQAWWFMVKIETSNQCLNLRERLSASVWKRLSFLEEATEGSNPYKDPWLSPPVFCSTVQAEFILSWKQKFDLRNPLARLSWTWANWPLSGPPFWISCRIASHHHPFTNPF